MSTSAVRTVYVSKGAAEDVVRGVVDAWIKDDGRALDVNVEFGDEYGYETAIDVFGTEDDAVLADGRTLAQKLAQAFPECDIAIDVDLERR